MRTKNVEKLLLRLKINLYLIYKKLLIILIMNNKNIQMKCLQMIKIDRTNIIQNLLHNYLVQIRNLKYHIQQIKKENYKNTRKNLKIEIKSLKLINTMSLLGFLPGNLGINYQMFQNKKLMNKMIILMQGHYLISVFRKRPLKLQHTLFRRRVKVNLKDHTSI